MNDRTRPFRGLALAGLAALVLAGCGAAPSGGDDGKVKVTASFYPMQFLAERIGGPHVDVTALTKPGVEPHDLELSFRQTVKLGEADLVVYLKGLQPAVDEAVKQSGAESVDAATLTSLEHHGTEVGGGHEEHGHGATDPHVWTDPVRFAAIAEGVGRALEKTDPDHAAAYAKNTGALVTKLHALDRSYRTGLAHTRTKTFLTTHAAFGYLAERYGLTEEGISGVDPESEPSPARVKHLQDIARREHVSTVFFETLASDRTAKTLARDAGLRTDVLDPVEGITPKSRGDDYLQVMESNLTALRKALGAS